MFTKIGCIKTACVVACFWISFFAEAATAPNSIITNIATANCTIGANNIVIASTVSVTTAACLDIDLKVELLQYIPSSGAALAPAGSRLETVQPTGYAPGGAIGGPFSLLANPILNGVPTLLPAALLLAPLSDAAGKSLAAYSRNEAIFIRVSSLDANLDPGVADRIALIISSNNGDSEVLQLTESGLSTGIFTGTVSSVFAAIGSAPIPHDGKITITSHNETLSAIYNHPNCSSGVNIASSSSGLIDPYGFVFDSSSGAPINGASLIKINLQTGLPATVYCSDGVTLLPQPIISGSPTVCDAVVTAGGYHFPLAQAGNYKLLVTPPPGLKFPSSAPSANLPALIGIPPVPPVILGNPGTAPGASYGGVFQLWGPSLRIDIPLDKISAALTLQKSADKAVVGIGEFVPYTLTIANSSATEQRSGVLIADHVPAGFRYMKGSARLNGAIMPDPHSTADARTLTFKFDLAPAAVVALRYVLEVTPGARLGMAENTALAVGGFTSNTARASLLVREDLFRNKAILIGRVIDGACHEQVDKQLTGLINARVALQDGSYVLTDREGRYHFDNLRAGTHVVQLDLDSLPANYEAYACENNDRFAGRSYTQFVNLRPGALWRADFHVRQKAPLSAKLTQTLSAKADGEHTVISLTLLGDAAVAGYSATVLLAEADRYQTGSATLNGKPLADPEIVGSALIFRSQGRSIFWKDQYRFHLVGQAQITQLKAALRLTLPDQATQSLPVLTLTDMAQEPQQCLQGLGGSAPTQRCASSMSSAADQADGTEVSKTVTLPVVLAPAAPVLKELNHEEDPNLLLENLPYDAQWLSQAEPGFEWLHPQESFHPNLPVVKLAVKHDPAHKLLLTVNDTLVNTLLFNGTLVDAQRKVALSNWNALPLKEGDNKIELRVSDGQGKEISKTVRTIYYASSPDHLEYLPQASLLLADGKTRPKIRVRFLDKRGVPVRRGISGEFQLNEPYRSHERHEGLEREPLTGQIGGKAHFLIQRDGLAVIELEPTTQSGEVILTFKFDGQRHQEVRAWLAAGQRDWILVGFGEGTLGHKSLSGNLQALQSAETGKPLYDHNKLAFYAKGSIKGEYLLTLAYDTAKQTGGTLLKQAVDPTQYYTLYADATQAQYDAASASRLYVKLERKQFYALFGDYDTGLSITELSRYSRTMNGVKSEYKGAKTGYSAFASINAQAYGKEEIPGNGTSGLYKLSRGNILINSDKLRIETRDRFQSRLILGTRNLTRYLDYDLDSVLGTLTFHEPVAIRDRDSNPIYIVVEYEAADPADQAATMGGRVHWQPGKDTEIGTTLIHEGTVGASGNLQGIDGSYRINEHSKLRLEAAATKRNLTGTPVSGSAWLGELQHHEEKWDARAYMRVQAAGFGMGQQASSEIATRKMGVDSQLTLSETMKLQTRAYRQESLSTNTSNLLLEGRLDQKIDADLNVYYGAHTSQDQSAAGSKQSEQLIAGASYLMADRKLVLHGAAEIGSGTAGSATTPDRISLGADYAVTEQTRLYVEQEIARGEQIAVNNGRVGVRTQPWSGGEVSATLGNSSNNDAERLYSHIGLGQRWRIDTHWQADIGIDRSQSLHTNAAPTNLNTTLPQGSTLMEDNYAVATFGASYHDKVWSGNGRMEIRNALLARQRNLQFGMQRNLEAGRSMSIGLTVRNVSAQTLSTRSNDLRISYAHRPNDSRWVWFDRADYISASSQSPTSTLKGMKLVNNLNANYMPDRSTQIALQYGAKFVGEIVDGTDYKGFTDLTGIELRHDLSRDWDMGVYASMLRSLKSGVRDYDMGASIGYNLMENTWLSLGYNVRGLSDRDFSAAAYRVRGLFLTLRVKLDQDSLGLNKGLASVPSLEPETEP